MQKNDNEFIWEEKYRPHVVEDCILPTIIKKKANIIIEKWQMQNMLFYSGPGTGKTTLAKALCEQLKLDYIVINGSLEGRLIDTVRNTVEKFVNTLSVFDNTGIKVVIYDEFDNVDSGSSVGNIQMAIRGLMQDVSKTCRFIFTCNYINRIIDPIQSRTNLVDFSITAKEKPQIMGEMLGRCCEILDIEGIPYDKKVLALFITKNFPDFRRVINELQAYSVMGKIDVGILELTTTRYDDLIEYILNKDFKSCIKWTTANNYDSTIYSTIIKNLKGKIDGIKYLEIILQADKYQYRHNFSTDPAITLWAFIIEIMSVI